MLRRITRPTTLFLILVLSASFLATLIIKPAAAANGYWDPDTTFYDSFEANNLTTNWQCSGSPTRTTAEAKTGTYSCYLQAFSEIDQTLGSYTHPDHATVDEWFKVDSFGTNSGGYGGANIMLFDEGGYDWFVWIYYNGSLAYRKAGYIELIQTLSTDTWYHIVIDWTNGSPMTVTLDGSLVYTTPINCPATFGWLYIWTVSGTSAAWYVDDVTLTSFIPVNGWVDIETAANGAVNLTDTDNSTIWSGYANRSFSYNPSVGINFNVTAYPSIGYTFVQWNFTYWDEDHWSVGDMRTDNPSPFGLSSTQPYYIITPEFAYSPTNKTLTMQTPIGDGTTTPTTGTHSYTYGDPAILTAYNGADTFYGWFLDGSTWAYDNPHTITNMYTNHTALAYFWNGNITVVISVRNNIGGTVTATPIGGSTTTTKTYSVADATLENFTAYPSSSAYLFDHWNVTIDLVFGPYEGYTANPLVDWTITGSPVTGGLTWRIEAVFVYTIDTFTMLTPTGLGTVTPTIGTHPYTPNATVTLTASPSKGWAFINWTIKLSNNTIINGTTATYSFTINQNCNATATFWPAYEYLRLQVSVGSGSAIFHNKTGVYDLPIGLTLWPKDSQLKIGAVASGAWSFSHWLIDNGTTTAQIIIVTMNGPHVILPVFIQAEIGSADYMTNLISSMLTMILLMCVVPFVLAWYFGKLGLMAGLVIMVIVGLIEGSFGAAYWQILFVTILGAILLLLGTFRGQGTGGGTGT